MNHINQAVASTIQEADPPATFTPFSMQASAPWTLQAFFDGPIPQVGDAVELVCYQANDNTLAFKFRVKA